MRVAGEAIARQAGIENGDLAAGTAELQGGGEAGKAAADDDDVIHGDGLRVVDRAGLGRARNIVPRYASRRPHSHRRTLSWYAPYSPPNKAESERSSGLIWKRLM